MRAGALGLTQNAIGDGAGLFVALTHYKSSAPHKTHTTQCAPVG